MSGHAFLAPSGAVQWGPGRCAASPTLQAQFPDPEGEEAKEGTVAHEYVARALVGDATTIGWRHENGYSLVQEMVDNGEDYLNGCRSIIAMAAQEPGATYYVEQKVLGHQWISPYCDGTPDFFAVFPQTRRVFLKDFKYGHGYVSEFRNYQLLVYLICIFETLGLGLPDDTWTIEVFIYQPRNYHSDGPVRAWRPFGSEVARWIEPFRAAAANAVVPGQMATVGPWCRYCTAALGCVTLQEAASHARAHASRAQVHISDPVALGRELKANKRSLAVLKARNEALEEQAMELVARGTRVWGWAGKYRDGRMKWNIPKSRVIALCRALGFDASKEETKTPKQMSDAGLDLSMVDHALITPKTYVLEEVTQDTLAKGFSENG